MNNPRTLPKLFVVVSSLYSVKVFLLDQLRAISDRFEITVVANSREERIQIGEGYAIRVMAVPIEREIRPLKDICALFQLARLLRNERVDVLHSITPKAGLLAMLAGLLSGTRRRVHTFTGQVWATATGVRRLLLKTCDRLTAHIATHVLVDSPSQLEFLVSEGVVTPSKAKVICNGSISGVDLQRFRANDALRKTVRGMLGISSEQLIYLFLGRLKRDKGVLDLAAAFRIVSCMCPSAVLVLVGPDEEALSGPIKASCADCCEKVHFVDFTDAPESYMAAADVLCLPSYREGFGSVVIEAAAVGLPTIATKIYGLRDAAVDGITGLLFDPGDVLGLASCMLRLAQDRELAKKMGLQGRLRVIEQFDNKTVLSFMNGYYSELIS